MANEVNVSAPPSPKTARSPVPAAAIRLLRIIAMAIGAFLILLGLALDWLEGQSLSLGRMQLLVIGVGCVYLFLGLLLPRLPGAFRQVVLALITLFVTLGLVEAAFRLVGYDLGKSQAVWDAYPICFRQPILPVGDVYYRRPGPDRWTGQVLYRGTAGANVVADAYADEEPITVTYDEQGFRNPEKLHDWDIVIVGDSFTELGYLPYEKLFTTRIGELVGARVKNCGVSYTGTLTHNYYLQHYGKGPSTRHAMLIFYEGNDIGDALAEHRRLQAFRATGQREYRDLNSKRQTSFVRALSHLLNPPQPFSVQNAVYRCGETEIPVTVACSAPDEQQLSPSDRAVIEGALAQWAETARQLGLTPWLVYMPCKRRVLDGCLDFKEGARKPIVEWKANELPRYIQGLCARNRIEFVDVTPVLREEALKGRLTYNAISDSHLNAYGSELVARVIAETFLARQRPASAGDREKTGTGEER